MADRTDDLRVEEEETFQRERGVAEMEAQLHQQEQGVVEMERAFYTRTDALRNLLSYLGEQERNLVARAEAIGPRAVELVEPLLDREADETDVQALESAIAEERRMLLERRQELVDARMKLVEDRERLYQGWYEKLDQAEAGIGSLEEKLLQRELEISQALRKLITSASELTGPKTGERKGGGEDDGAPRARKRSTAYTTQVRFNLEADLAGDEKHHFFRYEDDGAADLPGLFVATTNLLKEDREVMVTIGLGEAKVPAKGLVSWRRKPGDDDGEPGMGIELTWIRDEDRAVLDGWLAEHPPEVV